MAKILSSLLTLLFFLSGPASKGNAEIWHSPLAAKTPLGFRNAGAFDEFGGNLNTGLRNAGYDDVQGIFQGSSVTGKSYRTGQAFDVGRVSDFDVALSSPTLLQRAKDLGIPLRSQGARTAPLNPAHLEQLGLSDVATQLSGQAGRPVNL